MNRTVVIKVFGMVTFVALVVGMFKVTLPRAQGARNDGISVADAIKLSQRTGRPIFAVAGASYCPSCVKLMKTLNTDESLRPFLEQFVPLKINSRSSDYARWKQFFPPERSAIPALFIVTPQGKKLYSRVGGLPSKNLRKVMLTSLEKAGRYPTKEQWQEISKSLKSAEQAAVEDRAEQALELLQPTLAGLEKMGTLLELSETGKQTVALVDQLATKQRTVFDDALQAFISKANLDNALRVVAWEKFLGAFPQQKRSTAIAIKKNVRATDQRKLLRQARELYQAEALAGEPNSRRKALAALKRVAKRYPNTDVAVRAEQKLLALDATASAALRSK